MCGIRDNLAEIAAAFASIFLIPSVSEQIGVIKNMFKRQLAKNSFHPHFLLTDIALCRLPIDAPVLGLLNL